VPATTGSCNHASFDAFNCEYAAVAATQAENRFNPSRVVEVFSIAMSSISGYCRGIDREL
jgi:hypothetical protein